MARVSLSTAWDESRAILTRDGRLLVAVALALIVLPTVIVGLVVPTAGGERETYHRLLQAAGGLIGLIGQLALVRLVIGPPTTVGAAISHGARRFPSLLGAIILLVLMFLLMVIPVVLILAFTGSADLTNPSRAATGASAALILLMLIAILAISARFMVSTAVAGAEAVGPLAILKRSWSVTRGHYWKLLGLLLLLLVVAIVIMAAAAALGGVLGAIIDPDLEPMSLGALVMALFTGVGQGVFAVLSAVMVTRIYLQLAGAAGGPSREAEVTVPHSGT